MNLEFVDLILKRFASRNSLTLYKIDKEENPQRSFHIQRKVYHPKQGGWQIWLTDEVYTDIRDEWTGDRGIIVHVIKLGRLDTHQKFPATPETLNEILEKCLAIVKQGFADDGVEMSDDN